MTLVIISVVLLGIVFGTDQCEYYSQLKLSLLYAHTPSSTPCNITDLTSFPNSQFPLPCRDVNTMAISCWPYPIPLILNFMLSNSCFSLTGNVYYHSIPIQVCHSYPLISMEMVLQPLPLTNTPICGTRSLSLSSFSFLAS
jgi:hypothetical protein